MGQLLILMVTFSIKCNKGATLKFSYIGYKDATQVAMGTQNEYSTNGRRLRHWMKL